MSAVIRIDIWSDIACPWCYLGKHRLERGIEQFRRANGDRDEVQIEIESHSFELAPDTPETFEGSEVDFLTKHKGMSADQVTQMLGQMSELGASEGVTLDFDRVQHTNTRRAHRVLHLAKSQGLQAEMLERLFRAYFTEGLAISDPEVLAELGEEVGLDAGEVREAFDDEALGEAVDTDITRARMLGVTGVPYFLFDHKYAVPGAQSAEVFAGVLEQVLEYQTNPPAEG